MELKPAFPIEKFRILENNIKESVMAEFWRGCQLHTFYTRHWLSIWSDQFKLTPICSVSISYRFFKALMPTLTVANCDTR